MKLSTALKAKFYFHAYHAMRSSLECKEAQYQLHCRWLTEHLDKLLPVTKAIAKLVCVRGFEQAEKDFKAKKP